MDRPTHLLALLVCLTICSVAVWREMQGLAIVALIMSLAIIYKDQGKQVFNEGLKLLRRTKHAKLGDVEVQINDSIVNLTERLEEKAGSLRILLDGLDGDHVGCLLTVYKAGRYAPTAAIKEKLRPLRNRGLLTHDNATMATAEHVWLTPMGEEVAKILLSTTPELQENHPAAVPDTK